MKKLAIFSLAFLLVFSFMISCKKKVEEAPPPPPMEPVQEEQPMIEEQPVVEEVEEEPVVEEPQLTEEEIYLQKSLDEMNAEVPMEMIHFDFDKYFIRDDAKVVLEANAEWLQQFDSIQIVIEGHCDERGTEEYNLSLGEKRAKSTIDYLVSLGISADRIKIISYGKSQPIDLEHNEDAWQKNRRAQNTKNLN